MKKSQLGSLLIEAFTNGEMDRLADDLITGLRTHREKTIEILEDLLEQGEGKFRLKILETLLQDGASDLIPLFTNCVRWERNALYGKSMILLFKELKHQEALVALLSIESEIDHELKSTYQRTLGRLLSNFSEQFYMSEFRAGEGNPRRVRFAADMMMRTPHDAYVPFLNQLILNNDDGYRVEGLRVLRELGHASSSKPVSSVITRLLRQRKSLDQLMSALDTMERDPAVLFADFVAAAGMDWDTAQLEAYSDRIAQGDVDEIVDGLLDGFELTGEPRKKTRPLLMGMLSGSDASNFQEMRSAQALGEHGQALDQMIWNYSETLGELAGKHGEPNFVAKMEYFLPADHPKHDHVLISALSGYGGEDARDTLIDYINTCDDEQLVEHTLTALGRFDLDDLPKGVEKLCFREDNGLLRRQALELASKWGSGDVIAARLMDHSSLAVRADGIRAAATHQLKEAYPKIIAILESPESQESLTLAALEGVSAFDDPATVRAIRPLLIPPSTAQVRKAALHALFKSSISDRLEQIVKAYLQASPEKIWDTVEELLNLILQSDLEPIHDAVLKEREFWLKLLTKDNEGRCRGRLLELVESLDINDTYQARAWVMGLKRVLSAMGKILTDLEERRINVMIEEMDENIRVWNDRAKNEKILQSLLDGVRTDNPYQKVQGLRNLAQNYNPDLVADKPKALQQLVASVVEELDKPDIKKEMLLKAIEVARRMRHPKLHARLKNYLRFPDFDVRKAAKRAREVSVDPKFIKPIRNIFVMDDSRYITKQLSKVLARAGFDVDYENNVEDGMDRLAGGNFDLLILDIIMPGMNGAEFLSHARKQEIAPEFTLVITSTRNEEELQPLIKSGIDGLMLKPFKMEDLVEKIRALTPTAA